MKRNIVRAAFFAMLSLSLAAVAQAQGNGGCTLAMVSGSWAYTEIGTLYLPSGPVLLATVGNYTIDGDGKLLGARTSSNGGTISTATIKGTATVKDDCTGTVQLSFYSQTGNLVNTADKNVVYLNYANEARAIITSVHLPDGSSASAVMTTDAKKLFPGTQR